MKDNQRRCLRCGGRKKMYKVGSAYSMQPTGGPEVNCPLCAGSGSMPSVSEVKRQVGSKDALKKSNAKKIKKEVELNAKGDNEQEAR